jgi:hypothetical protein
MENGFPSNFHYWITLPSRLYETIPDTIDGIVILLILGEEQDPDRVRVVGKAEEGRCCHRHVGTSGIEHAAVGPGLCSHPNTRFPERLRSGLILVVYPWEL